MGTRAKASGRGIRKIGLTIFRHSGECRSPKAVRKPLDKHLSPLGEMMLSWHWQVGCDKRRGRRGAEDAEKNTRNSAFSAPLRPLRPLR